MAMAFANTKGSANKGKTDSYAYKDGDNKFRLVGDVLARYVYWIKGENNKDIPMECLGFNRAEERFDNVERDYVKETFPALKCGWAYAIQVIDPTDGKLKVCNLKKKLFEQILVAAEDLGDPTDPVTGWDVVFRKAKTGPLPINVEYTLQVLKCKPRELTSEELELIVGIKSMDEVMPRPSPQQQKDLLDKIKNGSPKENIDENLDEEFKVS